MSQDSHPLDRVLRVKKAERDSSRRKVHNADSARRSAMRQADELSARIEKLATDMQKSSKPGTIDVAALQQLDELNDILRKQRTELHNQSDDAMAVLGECRDELDRADRSVRTVERLKEIRDEDIRRQRNRRRAG